MSDQFRLDLAARTLQRTLALQTMRIEAAYPDLSELDREALDLARGVMVRLNKRDNAGHQPVAELLPVAPEIVALIERLANYLGETHALEKASEHYGDDVDETPCSYCEAIHEADEFLRLHRRNTL